MLVGLPVRTFNVRTNERAKRFSCVQWRSAQTVDKHVGGQPRAKSEMLAKPSGDHNEAKVIGMIDQRSHSVRPSDLFDCDVSIVCIIIEKIEPLEPPPFVMAGTFRANEISLSIEPLAHHFSWRES